MIGSEAACAVEPVGFTYMRVLLASAGHAALFRAFAQALAPVDRPPASPVASDSYQAESKRGTLNPARPEIHIPRVSLCSVIAANSAAP